MRVALEVQPHHDGRSQRDESCGGSHCPAPDAGLNRGMPSHCIVSGNGKVGAGLAATDTGCSAR